MASHSNMTVVIATIVVAMIVVNIPCMEAMPITNRENATKLETIYIRTLVLEDVFLYNSPTMNRYMTVCDIARGIMAVNDVVLTNNNTRLAVKQQIKDICQWILSLSKSDTAHQCSKDTDAESIVSGWCSEIAVYSNIQTEIANTLNSIKEAFVQVDNIFELKRDHRIRVAQGLPQEMADFLRDY